MRIDLIEKNKEQYLDLLLLADEQEEMVMKYLSKGDMFALFDDDLKSICVVTQDGDSCELKNIATYEKYQGQGYGGSLIKYLQEYYSGKCKVMYVGTGNCPDILGFYAKYGFTKSHSIENFFIDNYNHPIYEGDIQLVDMIYLKKEIRNKK